MRGRSVGAGLVLLGALLCAPGAAAQYSPQREADNFAKTQERSRYEHSKTEYRALLLQRGLEDDLAFRRQLAADLAKDPEGARDTSGNLCDDHQDGCAGDVRFYKWGQVTGNHQLPLLFTARNGATLSGHAWAAKRGPARRPVVSITNGSVQAPEQLYWYTAAVLARHGFVVLTWDPQGQGRSDTFGEGVDRNEGVPSQAGRPFYDGTEDALDFLLSNPSRPYAPRPSCTTGTSHAAKQRRRVGKGLNRPYNPLWRLVDSGRVGLAGHSFGARGVSFVGQKDPRVDGLVAWDNLGRPDTAAATAPCLSAPTTRLTPPISKPGLGASNDYGLTPEVKLAAPDPNSKNEAHGAYAAAGVDTLQVNTRGGTHYEYSYIPNSAFGATLRGMDMSAWYTRFWLDRYVKGAVSAERRLLTSRWRSDARGRQVDRAGDGNLYSFYLRSPLNLGRRSGTRAVCGDLRPGCSALRASDGERPNYSYLADAFGLSTDSLNTPVVPRGVLTARERRCILPRGRMRARSIGSARLGRTRRQQRRVLRGRPRKRRAYDSWCVIGRGRLRAGYRTRRPRLRRRAVLLLTSSKRYSLRGVTRGSSTRRLRRLRGRRRLRAGRSTWYLVPGRRSRLVFRTSRGRVREVGVADRRLTRRRRAARRLLRSFR